MSGNPIKAKSSYPILTKITPLNVKHDECTPKNKHSMFMQNSMGVQKFQSTQYLQSKNIETRKLRDILAI